MIEHLHSIPREFFWLFGILVVLLGISSVIAGWLRSRPADEKKAASRANLVERINAWWVMVAILAVAFLGGTTLTLVLFGLASFFALREFITLTPSNPGDRLPLSLSFFMVLPLQYVLIGLERYALMTDACVHRLGLDPTALGLKAGSESFDYLGDVAVWLRDLSPAFADTEATWVPPRRRPLLEAELRVPLAPMTLWEELTSSENRARVAFCAADRLAQVEEIVEWRPFASFARVVKLPDLPGDRRLTARHELQPDSDATMLRVRWLGSNATSDHARAEHDRLRALVT